MSKKAKENTRRAIAVMSAWLESDQDRELLVQTLLDLTAEEPDGDRQLVFGLINLAATLLVRAGQLTGHEEREIRQDTALRFTL